MSSLQNLSPHSLANFLNAIGYSSSFQLNEGQLALLSATKSEILETNSQITTNMIEEKYTKLFQSLSNHFGLQFSFKDVFSDYISLTKSTCTMSQFLNWLLVLDLIFSHFNQSLLKINVSTILTEKISMYQIGTFDPTNSLDQLYNTIQDKEEKPNYCVVVLIYIFSLFNQLTIDDNLTYDQFIKNLSLFNRTYFSHSNFALLAHIEAIVYINLYVYYSLGSSGSKNDSLSSNEIKFTTTQNSRNKKQKLSNYSMADMLKTKPGIRLKDGKSAVEIENFYLLENEQISYPYTDTIKPLMFQSFLKIFVFAHCSRMNIKMTINLTVQNPILCLKTKMNNQISNSSYKLFSSLDINMKSLSLTKAEIMSKDLITLAMKAFSFDEFVIQVIGFNTSDQIKGMLNVFENLFPRTNTLYVQEPAQNLEEYISIEALYLEWEILSLLLAFTLTKDLKKNPNQFSFRFNCFKCTVNRGFKFKELNLYFNYSNLKEKNLFVYFRGLKNLICLISKKLLIAEQLTQYKNYNISVRLFQNNFRSHQLSFFCQIIIKYFVNYVEEQGIKNIKIHETKFSSYVENCQYFLRDPDEKRKKVKQMKMKQAFKKITNPKFKFIHTYLNELLEQFDWITISEDEKSFNVLRTFEDNKIYFILKKIPESLVGTGNGANRDEQDYINIIICLSNNKDSYDKAMNLLQVIKADKENTLELRVTLVCDKVFLENSVLMDQKMKKNAKLLYQNVDDVYMIVKSAPAKEDGKKEEDQQQDYFNYDIYIADNYIVVGNFHKYDPSEDKKSSILVYEFLSILSSCVELIMYILKNKDIYIPRFAYIIRTSNEKYYSFEYKTCNIFVKQVKQFESLFTVNLKQGIPLFCLLSKKQTTQYTFSNENFYDLFLRLFLNLNKVVEDQAVLNETFFQKVHKNIFLDYYDAFYPVIFSSNFLTSLVNFLSENKYIEISKGDKFQNCYLIPFEKITKSTFTSVAKEESLAKNVQSFFFGLSSEYFYDNPNYMLFSFHKIDFFLEELQKLMKTERKGRSVIFRHLSKRIKDKEVIKKIFSLCFFGRMGEQFCFPREVFERISDDYTREKNKIKTQKVENRVIQLTENVKVPRGAGAQRRGGENCVAF